MALPVHPVTLPAVLVGKENGKLPAEILMPTPGQAGGPTVLLVTPAARGWRAMCAAAKTAGHVFKCGAGDPSYRSYERQEELFLQRFSETEICGRVVKCWQGKPWWLKRDVAQVAVPGTSNHGWGLAVDFGLELDGDLGAEDITPAAVSWLSANAHTYGFSAELQSEPFHWRYWAGDNIPAAVLAFEQETNGHDPIRDIELQALLAARDAEIAQLRVALREVTKALS